jgi:hypothetical protein
VYRTGTLVFGQIRRVRSMQAGPTTAGSFTGLR